MLINAAVTGVEPDHAARVTNEENSSDRKRRKKSR